MNAKWDFLETQNDAERIDFIAEALAVSVQLAVQKAMVLGGVSQRVLAERLGVSTARVSQILSANGRNLTLKTLGKIAHALGEDFEFIALRDIQKLKASARVKEVRTTTRVLAAAYVSNDNTWTDLTASENKFLWKNAA